MAQAVLLLHPPRAKRGTLEELGLYSPLYPKDASRRSERRNILQLSLLDTSIEDYYRREVFYVIRERGGTLRLKCRAGGFIEYSMPPKGNVVAVVRGYEFRCSYTIENGYVRVRIPNAYRGVILEGLSPEDRRIEATIAPDIYGLKILYKPREISFSLPISSHGSYAKGDRYCRRCGIWHPQGTERCPICNSMLRARPRKRRRQPPPRIEIGEGMDGS